jgi:dihydroxy-acid dehydratase
MKKAVTTRALDFTPDHVLVLRNAGPQGGPGMPEWGMLPMPKKLLKQGTATCCASRTRACPARATAPACCMSRRRAYRRPLALLRTGDIVELDVPARSIRMEVATTSSPAAAPPGRRRRRFERGYGWMFTKHIQQADEGCDFDFLRTDFGAPVPEPVIY